MNRKYKIIKVGYKSQLDAYINTHDIIELEEIEEQKECPTCANISVKSVNCGECGKPFKKIEDKKDPIGMAGNWAPNKPPEDELWQRLSFILQSKEVADEVVLITRQYFLNRFDKAWNHQGYSITENVPKAIRKEVFGAILKILRNN